MAKRECVLLSAGGSGYDLSNEYRPKRWGLQLVLRVFDSMAMGDQEQRWCGSIVCSIGLLRAGH